MCSSHLANQDFRQPRFDRRSTLEFFNMPISTEKGFLKHILGISGVSKKGIRQGKQRLGISVHEHFKRSRIPLLRVLDQFRISRVHAGLLLSIAERL
jgi:hypothetical protein